MKRLTDFVANPANPRSLSARARARRWEEFLGRFPNLDAMRILDLGGTPGYWRGASTRPAHVSVVNIDPSLRADEDWMRIVIADVCDHDLAERFDLVISNSLIEHIHPSKRGQFAEAVHRAADRTGSRRRIGTSRSSPTGCFPAFNFCHLAPVWRSREPGRSDTNMRTTASELPSSWRRWNCWVSRRCAATSPNPRSGSNDSQDCRSRSWQSEHEAARPGGGVSLTTDMPISR